MSATVVLVEGQSDRNALQALAHRRGLDLAARGVTIVAMGGITNLHHFLVRCDVAGRRCRAVGLYDAAQESVVRRSLVRSGLVVEQDDVDPQASGFYRCVPDLEAELISALGVTAVEAVISARGELGALRTLQKQRHWAGRPAQEQIRRFLGNSSRKTDYAALLVDALELGRVPVPLDEVLLDALRGRG